MRALTVHLIILVLGLIFFYVGLVCFDKYKAYKKINRTFTGPYAYEENMVFTKIIDSLKGKDHDKKAVE